MRRIDHIAYAVPDLGKASLLLAELLGCEVIIGGRHLNNGTHNALVNLGNDIYLELLAIDLDNKDIKAPKWMGVDLISKPRVTRWAIKSQEMHSDLSALNKYNSELGQSFEGSRKKQDGSLLKWQMALPAPAPEIEIAPFAVNWKDSIHPTASLPNECELLDIELTHPSPELFNTLFDDMNLDQKVSLGPKTQIKLKISSPNGIVELI